MDDKAVSEAVGYILIFGIMITAGSIVMLNASPALEDARQDQILDTADQAFVDLQSTTVEIVEEKAPKRVVAFNLQDNTLSMNNDPSRVEVKVDGEQFTADVTPITFKEDVYRVTMENNAVFSEQPDGIAMIHEPGWVITENFTVISTYALRGVGSVSTPGEVRVELLDPMRQRNVYTDAEIYVNISSTRHDAWHRYIEEEAQRVDNAEAIDAGTHVSLHIEDIDDVVYTHSQISARLDT